MLYPEHLNLNGGQVYRHVCFHKQAITLTLYLANYSSNIDCQTILELN